MSSNKIILGIDPGLVRTGWGVITQTGNQVKYINCGIISTNPKETMEARLMRIYDSVQEIIDAFQIDYAAMEEVFVNTNVKTSEKLIMARTAAFLAISKSNLTVNSFRPNEIKKNITGSGHATKEQVQIMVQKILNTKIDKDKNHTFDSLDALAIALCAAFNSGKL